MKLWPILPAGTLALILGIGYEFHKELDAASAVHPVLVRHDLLKTDEVTTHGILGHEGKAYPTTITMTNQDAFRLIAEEFAKTPDASLDNLTLSPEQMNEAREFGEKLQRFDGHTGKVYNQTLEALQVVQELRAKG